MPGCVSARVFVRTASDRKWRHPSWKTARSSDYSYGTKFSPDKTRECRAVSPLFCGLCTAGMGGERTTTCLAGVRPAVARKRLARTRRSGYSRTRLAKAEARVAKLPIKRRAFRLKTRSQQRLYLENGPSDTGDGGELARRATSIEHTHLSLPTEVSPHERKSCVFFVFFPSACDPFGLGWAGS